MMTGLRRWSLTAMAILTGTLGSSQARADLDDYIKKADPGYTWSLIKTESSAAGTTTFIKLTSQVWQGIPWNHEMRIYEPKEIKYPDGVLLFITGGSTTSQVKPEDALMGFGLAKLCGSRVAVLPQVPNQPLFGGKTEDTLIAETFARYLETKDESWPLLFPMAKSAVKAMDCVQEWQKKEGKTVSTKFVVSGASKRGWTTWLTGASDKRVVAIAPMVIDTLNMKEQRVHSLEVWGKFSEQIGDYTERGLTEKFEDPVGSKLWKMVDPYSYLDRLTMPKLLINGTNDRYWTLDALNIYWNDLKGQKSVVYLPNAGHNLAVNRDYALNGVGALFRSTLSGSPWPQLTWKLDDSDPDTVGISITSFKMPQPGAIVATPDGGRALEMKMSPQPTGMKYWVAKSATRDFREAVWESTTVEGKPTTARVGAVRPATGYIAILGDVSYEIDGIPFHLSTQILQSGPKRRSEETIMATVEEPLVRLFDVDEYHRMASAGILGPDDRVELIDGVIVTMSPIGTWHNAIVARLSVLIYQRFGVNIVLYTQGSIRLNRRSELQPDLALLHPRDDFYVNVHAGPDDVFLLIEVIEPSRAYDRGRKPGVYGRAGIKEAWLVDRFADCIEVYTDPRRGVYSRMTPAQRGASVSPLAFPNISLEVNEILGPAESLS